ncbi:MAG: UDP-glucose 4-epimerase GalE [Oscillospiraceae bacterium]|nr:UDP-glucose 4-epimerase GalE [Oscillospiraceae bacterium]
MSVLLTGGAGFIGSHTAVEMIKAGYDVIIADDLSNASPKVLDRLETITGVRPKFYRIDVADRAALEPVFRDNQIDGVIHFAGFKCVPESTKLPLKYYRNNLDTALTTLEVMEDYGCKAFVFSSSATVYGEKNVAPFTEDMPTGTATNPYGTTKLMIEQIVTDAAAANDKLSAVLLRYFNPIGAHPSGLIGEAPNGVPNNLMPYITQVAVGKREHLSVYGNDYPTPDGTGVRDYIHVVDLAIGHVKAMDYALKHTGSVAINLGTGKGSSVLEVVRAFEEASGVQIPLVITDRRPGDIATCYADASRAKALLGWEARYTLTEMCAHSWNWQNHNPKGYDD